MLLIYWKIIECDVRYSILILFLIALILSSARAQTPRSSIVEAIPNVSFCNMLKNPQIYGGKVVRFRAIFTRGGEDWVAIYCPECSTDKNLVRLEFDETFDQLTSSKIRRRFEQPDITLEVTLVGNLDPSHPLLFHIIRAERADVISKQGTSPWRLPNKLKTRKTC
ncbi:MAG TPA: hypothetical protein VFF31_26035 [Blastocatellia bacterium]|nr:hypothetical protein [Blastocatellia bacterium]